MQAIRARRTPAPAPHLPECLLHAIDMLDLGIALVGREGRIAFANQAAAALLHVRETAHSGGRPAGQSRAVMAAIDQHLRAAIRRGNQECYFSLPMADGRSLFVLSIPCRSGDERVSDDITNILFVTEPSRQALRDLSAIAPHYGLTRAETRLLQALVRGDTIGIYAKRVGITLNTAKGYLKQLFRKTSTARQSDLVRLILADPILHLVSAQPDGVAGHS